MAKARGQLFLLLWLVFTNIRREECEKSGQYWNIWSIGMSAVLEGFKITRLIILNGYTEGKYIYGRHKNK